MNAATLRYELRRAQTRGRLHAGWLDARFSFSFGSWRDPRHDRYGVLVALNEDVVQPGTGFAMHPHRDLEIVIVPRAGAVEHRDDQGRHGIVRPGEVQMMRAGRGIRHSQMNPSAHQPDRHFQIWLEPRTKGLEPAVVQRRFGAPQPGRWLRIASPDGQDGSLVIDQDAQILIGAAPPDGEPLQHAPAAGRSLYLHVMDGGADVRLDGGRTETLGPGDALALDEPGARLEVRGAPHAELLLFDLPRVQPAGR